MHTHLVFRLALSSCHSLNSTASLKGLSDSTKVLCRTAAVRWSSRHRGKPNQALLRRGNRCDFTPEEEKPYRMGLSAIMAEPDEERGRWGGLVCWRGHRMRERERERERERGADSIACVCSSLKERDREVGWAGNPQETKSCPLILGEAPGLDNTHTLTSMHTQTETHTYT